MPTLVNTSMSSFLPPLTDTPTVADHSCNLGSGGIDMRSDMLSFISLSSFRVVDMESWNPIASVALRAMVTARLA